MVETLKEQFEKHREKLMAYHTRIYNALPEDFRNMGLSLLWDLSASIGNAMDCQIDTSLERFNRYTIGVTSLMNTIPKEARGGSITFI